MSEEGDYFEYDIGDVVFCSGRASIILQRHVGKEQNVFYEVLVGTNKEWRWQKRIKIDTLSTGENYEFVHLAHHYNKSLFNE